MKKTLQLFACVLIAAVANAQMGHSPLTLNVQAGTSQKNQMINSVHATPTSKENASTTFSSNRVINPTVQFANDVIIKTDTTDQRHAKVATAFNGWIYSACSITSPGFGGIQVRVSKDGGLTWTDFETGLYPNVDYAAVDISVAGTDTTNLFVFVAGVYHDQVGGNYSAWIDKLQGTTGAFLGENFNEGSTSQIYDVAIATDYVNPSYLSTPFSMGLIYSKYGSTLDSVVYACSIDGGTTYATREGVYGTSGYCGKVAIAFGKCATYSNGRYFIAFESKNGQSDNVGHVAFTHTVSDPTTNFQTPIFIDSLNAGFTGRLGHPRIACNYNGVDNDSFNITTVIAVDRAWTSTDYDAIAMYSKLSVYSGLQNWHGDAISSSGDYETGTDVVWNDSLLSFDATFYDSTIHTLQSVYNNVNIPAANSWTNFNVQYNDLTTNVIQPFPRLSVNPTLGADNYVWNSEGATNGVSLFDAELYPTGIPTLSSSYKFGTPFPNPSTGIVNFQYELFSNQHVQLSIVNMMGQEVIPTIDRGTQAAGNQNLSVDFSTIPNGIYMYRFISGNEIKTGNLVITR